MSENLLNSKLPSFGTLFVSGMGTIMYILQALLRDETGATVVEYGLIVSLVILAMVGALGAVADSTVGMWNDISNKISTVG